MDICCVFMGFNNCFWRLSEVEVDAEAEARLRSASKSKKAQVPRGAFEPLKDMDRVSEIVL